MIPIFSKNSKNPFDLVLLRLWEIARVITAMSRRNIDRFRGGADEIRAVKRLIIEFY